MLYFFIICQKTKLTPIKLSKVICHKPAASRDNKSKSDSDKVAKFN